MATEQSKEQFTVNGNILTMNEVTDTTLLEYKDKLLELYPNMEIRPYTDKDKNPKVKLVFKGQSVEIPEEIVKASKKTIESIGKSVYTLALDSFKVLARATFLESVKDSLGIPKGVGGITPEGRAKKKYVEMGGTFKDDGTPNNDATMVIMGQTIKGVTLDALVSYEKGNKA
jgi:hypothetical protein